MILHNGGKTGNAFSLDVLYDKTEEIQLIQLTDFLTSLDMLLL
jgi:hypothetical protein